MDGQGLSACVPAQHRAPYSIDFKGLEKDVDEGKNARLLFLLEIFSNSLLSQSLMARDPAACFRLSKLLVKAGAISPLPQHLVDGMLSRFRAHHVLSRIDLQENLTVKCNKGKEVKFNETLLALSGEYFRQQIVEHGKTLSIPRSATAMTAWKASLLCGSVDKQPLGLRHLTELYAMALQNQVSCLADQSKNWVLVKMNEWLTEEDRLFCYIERLPSYGLPPENQAQLELQALVDFLDFKKIPSAFSLDKRHLCLSASFLSLLQEENILGTLLKKHVRGILFKQDEDVSAACLFGVAAENDLKENMLEIVIQKELGSEELRHLSSLFPNIETMSLSFDILPTQHLCGEGLLSFLANHRELAGVRWCDAATLQRYVQGCSSFSALKQMRIISSAACKVGLFHEPGEEIGYKPLVVTSGSYYLGFDKFQINPDEIINSLKNRLQFTTAKRLIGYKENYLMNCYSFFCLNTQNS